MSNIKVGNKDESSLSSYDSELESSFIGRMKFCANKLGSVSALAREAGISQSGIRRYFTGGEPSRPHLVAIADAAGVTPTWLATGREDSDWPMVREPRVTFTTEDQPPSLDVAVYARLVGPLHDLVEEEGDREEVMLLTLQILRAASRNDNGVISRFSSEDLRAAVSLAQASKRIEEGRV